MLEAAAATTAQLEATERSLARAEGAKAEAEQLAKRQARGLTPSYPYPYPRPNPGPNPNPNPSPKY